jgi:hypothetical protein
MSASSRLGNGPDSGLVLALSQEWRAYRARGILYEQQSANPLLAVTYPADFPDQLTLEKIASEGSKLTPLERKRWFETTGPDGAIVRRWLVRSKQAGRCVNLIRVQMSLLAKIFSEFAFRAREEKLLRTLSLSQLRVRMVLEYS